MKKLVLLITLFWAIANAFFALDPHLEVTALDSVAIPYEYDYVMQLSNGDLQFYKLNYGTSSIQFYGFQYLAQTNEVTPQIDLGTTTGLNGLTTYDLYWEWIFNRFYLVHKLSSGISIIILNQHLLTSRLFSSDSFDQFFNLSIMTGIVAEDAITIALSESLVYYNFINNTCLTLLQGEGYQCSPGQDPVVIALPDSHFLYCKDSSVGIGGPPETWALFNSQGGYISTQSSTDPDLLMSFFRKDTGMAPFKVHGVWYIACPQIAMADAWLEFTLVMLILFTIYYSTLVQTRR
jgi:hypothetical protein